MMRGHEIIKCIAEQSAEHYDKMVTNHTKIIVDACIKELNRPTDLEQVRKAVECLSHNLYHISFCNDIIARYGRKLRQANEHNRVGAPNPYSQEYFDNYQNAIDDFNKQIESYKENIDKIISEL